MAGHLCDPSVPVTTKRVWDFYILVSLAIYFGGIVVILLVRGVLNFISPDRKKNAVHVDGDDEEEDFEEVEIGFYLNMTEQASLLVSAQNFQGRMLSVISFIFNLVCVAMYTTVSADPIEHCFMFDHYFWKIEVTLHIFFFLHLCIRFFAAHDKLEFWAGDSFVIIDILTMPTIFGPLFVNQTWLGLRFLRIAYILNMAEILQFLNVLKTGQAVEMMEMLGNFLTIWLGSAGMVHLIENTGDPWSPIDYRNRRDINYFDATYFLLVTMSTVGYGDYFCETYLGKIFGMMFIGVGLGLFASYLPAISEFLASHTKYHKDFKPIPGKRYVVVCGYITHESVASFLRDFLHPDRDDNVTMVVFLAPDFPNVNIQTVLKKYETRASYYMGTIYSSLDAMRMKVMTADAVIILCNKKCPNPDEEDAANITRVIAVKNYKESIRCIVQLMMNRNKVHLMNCPQWSTNSFGDAIVCINELKLGFIAQSCNAPGFSTLVGNLFGMRNDQTAEEIPEIEQWKVAYMLGAAHEMYSTYLSNAFIGMTFPQAVELCFEKLGLLLIAIELKSNKGKQFAINPMDKKLKLTKNTRGFFIAQSAIDSERATRYCNTCHKDLIDPERMIRCKCRKNQQPVVKETKVDIDPVHLLEVEQEDEKKNSRTLTDDYFPNGDKPKFDQSGTFYWCENRSFASAKLTLEEAATEKFSKHVVILVLSSRYSPSLELRQLILPLRASNNVPSHMKKVVILGDGDFLQREWLRLANFPDVHIVPGSPYNRQDVRSVNVDEADMCILLSPGNMTGTEVEHQALSDKEVILLTLNLKAMEFAEKPPEKPLQLTITDSALPLLGEEEGNEEEGAEGEQEEGVGEEGDAGADSGRESASPSEVVEASEAIAPPPMTARDLVPPKMVKVNMKIISELIYDSNAMYLDQDDMNIYDDENFYLTQPYASGCVFTVSVLDSLVSATYFNGDILVLIQNLVTGIVSSELDELLAEGKQPLGSFETIDIANVRNRCRIGQVDLADGPLSEFGECGVYGDLFLYALRTYNMICLGLYRLRDASRLRTKSIKRYVITFPDFNFVLSPTDRVFVLQQFQAVKKKKKTFQSKNASFV